RSFTRSFNTEQFRQPAQSMTNNIGSTYLLRRSMRKNRMRIDFFWDERNVGVFSRRRDGRAV
ncbi:MAG: hypothetical protein ACK54A_11600, partial [Sphingobacteriales bacterium]